MDKWREKARPGRQRGISLIEVMIAMLLSMFLLGGIVQAYISSRQTHRVQEATARMQEAGRMALEVISRDVRMADFWGCISDVADLVNNLNSGGAGYVDFGAGGIEGTDGGGGSDTLILRGGFDRGLPLLPPFGPLASANLSTAAGNGLSQGDIVIVSDCESGDIFQISNSNPNTSGSVVHNTGSATEPGNYNATNPGCVGANAHCLSKIYGADATIFQTRQITYSIGMGSEGQPALFRNGQEFLDGIEDLQVLYGEDIDAEGAAGFGVADYYVPADQVADMLRVVSIRLAIVTRSYDDNLTGGLNQQYVVLGEDRAAADERLRQVYTSTVAIRNRI